MRKKILLTLFCCVFMTTYSQKTKKSHKIRFTQIDKKQEKDSPLSLLSSKLKPGSGVEFKQVKSKTDKKNFKHTIYQQYYRGIKIEHGQVKFHEKNGLLKSYSGAYYEPNSLNTSPRVQKSRAISIAERFMGGNKVFWLDEEGISKTNTPKTELVILPNRKNETLQLAYKIGLGTSQGELKMGFLYIDAQTGAVLKFKNQVFFCFEDEKKTTEGYINNKITSDLVAGSGVTAYSGSQNIETTLDGSNYILYDQSRANSGQAHNYGSGQKYGIVTVNFNNSESLNDYGDSSVVTEFSDADNNWTAAEMSSDENQYALDAHWGTQVVYDYWKNEQGRDSYDDGGSTIASYIHYKTDYTNAGWVAFSDAKGFMVYGDGGGSYTPLTNLDVVSHEIAHGVTNATSSLDYELESGALNEGFSDIWAMVIDNYANLNLGTSKNIGLLNDENGGGVLRSMSSPNSYGQPDTYGGTYWTDVSSCTPDGTNNDYCGVHTNSGVLNYWFWLLSQGGTGSNDNGDSFSVTAVGMDVAAAIAYRMQDVYLTSTSDYEDARAAGIQSAKDLYGNCSAEEEAVTNAFYAVGVGVVYSGEKPSITTDISSIEVCETTTVVLTTEASNVDSSRWQVNDGSSWSDVSASGVYSGEGTNTLTIVTEFSLDGYQYRNKYTNSCGNTNSTAITLTVEELPVTTNITTSGAGCSSTTDGSITLTFNDNSNRTNIEYSIDGGTTYSYNYKDDVGSATISGIAAGDYDIWVRWGNDECPLEIGIYTVETIISPTVSVDNIIEADLGESDGILQVSFSDLTDQTAIKFSIDGGTTYPYSFDDTIATGEISGLAAATYNIWVATGDDSCAKELGDFTVSEIAYTQIPDANFENALNDLSYDNYLGDGKVPTSLINTVTFLNVRLKNIADMTGVEGFTLLEELYCDNNELTSVDVSSNTALKELLVYNNYNLTSFSVANPAIIERLAFSSCSLTGRYDFSAYTVLTNFSVKGNDLTGLNIKNGNNSNFTYFDARGNGNLNCIVVDDESYSADEWTQSGGATYTDNDYCDYTLITDVKFENALEALGYDDISSDGQVPTDLIEVIIDLDVTSKEITDLTGIEYFTALEKLTVSENSLSDINLTNNVLLEEFYCENNGLTTIDVSKNLVLITLDLDDNDLTTLDVSLNTALKTLDLSRNLLTSINVVTNTDLQFLAFEENNVSGAIDLSNNSKLKVFACNDNDIASLNIKNGTNTSILGFNAANNERLTCILVDDISNDYSSWVKDNAASFNDVLCTLYTTIPDAIFEAELENLGYDDISGDGQIPTALIEVVTDLDVSSKEIADLTGIEDFIALKKLDCEVNDITSLDLSNNTLLEWIDCDRNQLTTLTFGANINLTTIICNNNTSLTSLDLSNNTALDYVQLSNNGLTSVNINNLPLLKSFSCGGNSLTTLDVSDNIGLEILNFSNNSLTSIDVTNNPVLFYLAADENDLTSLDVNSNTELLNLVVSGNTIASLNTSNNTKLEWLIATDNSLTSLDLSNNPLLEKLWFGENGLTNISVANNIAIKELVGPGNLLTSLDVSNNTILEWLYVDNNSIESLDISKNTVLTSLTCNDNELTSLNLKNGNNASLTFSILNNNPNLTCILVDDLTNDYSSWSKDLTASYNDTYCDYTLIPDSNFEAKLEALGYDDISGDGQVPTALIEVVTSLDVRSSSISDLTGLEDFTALVTLLCRASGISTIDVSQNLLLETLTANNNSISTIDLSNNIALKSVNLGANGLSTLDVSNNTALTSLSLQSSGSLTVLDVSKNVLLKELKTYNSGITTLDISKNIALETLQVYNSPITAIDVSNNPDIKDLRVHSTNITVLDLSNNPDIEQLRVNSTNIESLDLSSQIVLQKLYANDMSLNSLNVQNGNNTNITVFRGTGNPDLNCILVDDLVNDYSSWTKDATTSFNDGGYCDYTAIPDANFEAALDALGYDDVTADGQVPTELINTVTSLLVNVKSIGDLTGIEDFVALTYLDVRGNALTSLDVSSNALLETLLCQDNGVLASLNLRNTSVLRTLVCDGNQLTTLNIDDCIALENINISFNSITSINLSNNSVLNTFTAEQTGVTDLDFRYNPLLVEVEVIDSALTSLNIKNGKNTAIQDFYTTGNTGLTCIQVDDATYSATNWKDIDVETSFSEASCSIYTAIPDANFEAALEALGLDDISGDGQVPTALIEVATSLAIRGKGISDLTGIENFTALTTLNVSNNSLTSINIYNNTALETAFLSENQLSALNFTNNTSLTYLDLSENTVSTLDVSNNTALTILDISDNNFIAIDVTTLTSLESLYISDNDITTINVANSPLLKNFGADNCQLSSFDASGLAYLESITIQSNPDIETLNVSGATSLKNLVVRYGKLSAADVSTNINLELIFLDGHELTSFNITNNPLVRLLLLSDNNLSSLDLRNGNTEGLTSFQSRTNASLTCINVDNPTYAKANLTDIDDHTSFGINVCGVYAYVPDDNFEAALGSLGYDDVANDNQIPLANMKTSTTLDVSGKNIVDLTGIEEFVALTSLNVSSNAIVTADLSTNPLLSVLDISGNQITQLDLSTNTAITTIDVSENDLLSFNIQNGTNTGITSLDATSNSNLECILVDVATYSTTNWKAIDDQTSFNETDCTSYTAIPDANFEAALEALGYDNISGDGQVPTLNINTITSLNVASKNIADLTGIEDFGALTTLDCSLNVLTTIDVSKNVNLIDLDADENQFTSIDISNNILLQDLDLDNCFITSIDLTNNTQLVDVDLEGNELTSIDLSKNLLLQVIDLETNDLTSLDTAVNILLEELDIEANEIARLVLPTSTSLVDFDGTNNKLTSIDVSNYINLVVLDLDENQLTTLDVSSNTKLTRLKTNENNLTYLNVKNGTNEGSLSTFTANNNLSLTCILVDDATYSTLNWASIDVTSNFSDTYCRYTAIPDAKFEAKLYSLGYDDISGDGQVPTALIEVVTTFTAQYEDITDFTGIEDFTAIESLTVSYNSFTSLDVSNNTKLTFLNCGYSSLTSLDVSNNLLLETLWINSSAVSSIDLSLHTSFKALVASSISNLVGLKMNNGNNTNVTQFTTAGSTNLTCILVDDLTNDYSLWTKEATTSFSETYCNSVVIAAKVFLEGAATNPNSGEESWMRDDLRIAGGVYGPTSPYGDGATISESVGTDDVGANSMVDWVWVELRDATDPTIVIDGKSAVLQRDGDVVDVDDDRTSPLTFEGITSDNYYVVISHRNHISIRSATTISLSSSSTSVNFSSSVATVTGGANALIDMGNSIYAMPSGDYDGNGEIQTIDASSVISVIGSSGYHKADMDMNGEIQTIDIDNVINKNVGKGQQF